MTSPSAAAQPAWPKTGDLPLVLRFCSQEQMEAFYQTYFYIHFYYRKLLIFILFLIY
jgi:hypothetical protein